MNTQNQERRVCVTTFTSHYLYSLQWQIQSVTFNGKDTIFGKLDPKNCKRKINWSCGYRNKLTFERLRIRIHPKDIGNEVSSRMLIATAQMKSEQKK